MFIIQACRGGKFDYGVETESTDLGESQVIEVMKQNYDNISEKVFYNLFPIHMYCICICTYVHIHITEVQVCVIVYACLYYTGVYIHVHVLHTCTCTFVLVHATLKI